MVKGKNSNFKNKIANSHPKQDIHGSMRFRKTGANLKGFLCKHISVQETHQTTSQSTFSNIQAHVPRVPSNHTESLSVQLPLIRWEGSDMLLHWFTIPLSYGALCHILFFSWEGALSKLLSGVLSDFIFDCHVDCAAVCWASTFLQWLGGIYCDKGSLTCIVSGTAPLIWLIRGSSCIQRCLQEVIRHKWTQTKWMEITLKFKW